MCWIWKLIAALSQVRLPNESHLVQDASLCLAKRGGVLVLEIHTCLLVLRLRCTDE